MGSRGLGSLLRAVSVRCWRHRIFPIFREATLRDDGQHSVKGMKRGMEEAGARDGECEKVTTSLFHTIP